MAFDVLYLIRYMPYNAEMKRLPARFYCLPGGREPVREWLKSLGADDKQSIGDDIRTVEYGWPIGMPACRPLGDGLWEVRSNLTDRRISRVIFCIAHGHMFLLHAFIKKTRKTPVTDLVIARRRQKEVEQ
jgi:phage-related protein